MNPQETHEPDHSEAKDLALFEDLIRAVTEQFDIVMGNPARVADACGQLRSFFSNSPSQKEIDRLFLLLPLLTKRSDALVKPVFDLLEEVVSTAEKPWTLLKGMLAVMDPDLAGRALQLSLQLAERRSLEVDLRVIRAVAEQVDVPDKPLGNPTHLPLIHALLSHLVPRSFDSVTELFFHVNDGTVRRLAARILDQKGEPVDGAIAEKVLGTEAYKFLAPYLSFMRTGYLELLSLVPFSGKPPPSLHSLRSARCILGETMMRQVVAELGWQRINLNLEVRHLIPFSVGGSIPLMLHPSEAALLASCGESYPSSDIFVVIAHGSEAMSEDVQNGVMDPATKFRLYNLAHAALLAEFLAVAPLTADKIRDMFLQMDRIVRDFVELFSEFTEECTTLPDLYSHLKNEILSGVHAHEGHGPLSAELTRLVMAFEDPRSLNEVRTLHGLKRYLHQKGLQLGFRLVLRSRTTNRTVDLLLVSRAMAKPISFKGIRYTDFEPDTDDESSYAPPYSIAVVAEGFARQLLYGQENFPRVDIFCYGNEVHYYLSFRNHPAFLRINYAPPLQGGMIDLEYFGVSKFELSQHPDLSLQALKRFFQYLEFDIRIENTRVHARYDKEHAHDLESLCHKVEGIFRLAPYLLEIDWTIGSLQLDAAAKKKAADAWAAAFAHWGILPLRDILTNDRTSVVESIEETPSGKKETKWNGDVPYKDRLVLRPGEDFYNRLCAAIEKLNIGIISARAEEGHRRFGQIRIERWLLIPLRKAVARGELIETSVGFRRVSSELFARVHETEYFTSLLDGEDRILLQSTELAQYIEPLERALDFRTTGFIGGHEVQFARLPLRGEELGIYVLRESKNVIRLAFYTRGTVVFCRRNVPTESWSLNAQCDVKAFVSQLRKTNYPVSACNSLTYTSEDIARLRREMSEESLLSEQKPVAGEYVVSGLSASPGRAVGRVLFEITGKKPEELDGNILLASAIRPEDNAFIYHAAGIISTGGGILSHAGLLANQFHKPAVIIQGRWEPQKNAPPLLRCLSLEYELEEKEIAGYRVHLRNNIRERERFLREGDLIVVEAGEGRIRVLGQDPDTLSLHEALAQFGKASCELARSTSDHDVLTLRGRRLRARHQIEKMLTRLTKPAMACHAVYELLLGRDISNRIVPVSEKTSLFDLILNHPDVGTIAREHLRYIIGEMQRRLEARLRKAIHHIPISNSIYEVLNMRLDALQTGRSLEEAETCLRSCGIPDIASGASMAAQLDAVTKERITTLCKRLCTALIDKSIEPRTRHLLRDAERLNLLIEIPDENRERIKISSHRLKQEDHEMFQKYNEQNIIVPENGGFELHSLIGWKAANLGEIGKLTDRRWVPCWFAVTDHAFRSILNAPLEKVLSNDAERPQHARTLNESIGLILAQPSSSYAQKSVSIRNLWDAVQLPQKLADEVTRAYRSLRLSSTDPDPYVAIRSSSREEDAEAAARAGEFETFLYIQGNSAVLEHLKRTWSGLWSERAIHNRFVLGHPSDVTGGGVIIQRIVDSRISGVLQTVNVGRNDMREMIINAGLGLGEGIVSGTVAADQITVSKDHDPNKEHLQFNYVTADKKEYVVFNKRAGMGTIRCDAPYHKRLRPALEYVELCELVSKARELESAYGYPLDIEFGIEGATIWILQVRPVPSFLTAVQETLQKYPLNADGSVVENIERRMPS